MCVTQRMKKTKGNPMSSKHTLKNLEKVKAYYGVTEETLRTQTAEILGKMLEAAHDDNVDELHQLGYYIFSANTAC